MPMHTRVGGVWKTVTPKVKVAGAWKTVSGGWVKVAGVWRKFFTSALSLAITHGASTYATAAGNKTLTVPGVVGDLLVVYATATDCANSGTLTDNQGGTYTLVTAAVKNAGVDILAVFVRDQLMANTNSHVLTWVPPTNTGGGMTGYRITGMPNAGAAAIKQSAVKHNINAGVVCTTLFGAQRTPGNAIISGVCTTSNPVAMTPDSNFTGMGSGGYNIPTTGFAGQTQIVSSSIGASIPWATAAPSAACAASVEIGQ